jgi:nitronate monooxygenase
VISASMMLLEMPTHTGYKVADMTQGLRKKGTEEKGDGFVFSKVIGLVDDIPTCAELVTRMVAECREGLEQALNRFDR